LKLKGNNQETEGRQDGSNLKKNQNSREYFKQGVIIDDADSNPDYFVLSGNRIFFFFLLSGA
jgi:hypothetical protein